MRHLDVKNMQVLQDYAHRRYFVQLKPNDTYADLFVPTFWAYHKGKLEKNDLIRVRAENGSFDVTVTVVDVKVDGIVMQRWPIEPPAEALVQAAEIGKAERVVPFGSDGRPKVRIDHLPATKWRVIGLHSEVSQGHETEAAAIKAMQGYLEGIRYVMPSAQAQAEALQTHDAKQAIEAEQVASRRAGSKR